MPVGVFIRTKENTEKSKKAHQTEEYREKARQRGIKQFSTLEAKEKQKQKITKYFSDPKAREKASKSAIERFKNPNEREKARERNTGEKNWQWKGQNANLSAIHLWVRKWKGTPDTCENCGKSGFTGRKINWANIDHKYRRVLEDYIRLCTKCHGKYDTEHGLRKRKKIT